MTGLSTNQIAGLPHLHIQDGAMMKKGCDVTSGGPNKARPEVKMEKHVYKGRNEWILGHSG